MALRSLEGRHTLGVAHEAEADEERVEAGRRRRRGMEDEAAGVLEDAGKIAVGGVDVCAPELALAEGVGGSGQVFAGEAQS